MRAIVAAILVILAIIALTQMGVGQGETACARDCQEAHCTMPNTDSMDCGNDEFRACAAACRKAP